MIMSFIGLIPETKQDDQRFMSMALAFERAINAFVEEGGDPIEVPMLASVVITNIAARADDPLRLLDNMHRFQRLPFERRRD